MALIPLNFSPHASLSLPPEVADFLRDADSRIDQFTEQTRSNPHPAFVQSDFPLVYTALATLREQTSHCSPPGDLFCEWGSGFGVVAMLAAMLGYESHGIEIEPLLVEESQNLADDYDLSVQFVCGTLIPPGADSLTDAPTDFAVLAPGGQNAYAELGLDLDDFDLIFAFPWPGEEQTLNKIFHHHAAPGALLLTYHGLDDLKLQRKE